jgi:hypothetical protein
MQWSASPNATTRRIGYQRLGGNEIRLLAQITSRKRHTPLRRRKRDTRVRLLSRADVSILAEVDDNAAQAAAGECRVVSPGPLVFFSTTTGDALLLDSQDSLALCLVHEAARLPVTETPGRFAIEWNGAFQVEGEVMPTTRAVSVRSLGTLHMKLRKPSDEPGCEGLRSKSSIPHCQRHTEAGRLPERYPASMRSISHYCSFSSVADPGNPAYSTLIFSVCRRL